MKKTLLFLLLMTAFNIGTKAQQLIQQDSSKGYIPTNIPLLFKETNVHSLSKKSDPAVKARYSFVDSARNYTTFRGYNNTFLFPDSTVKQIYGSPQGGMVLGGVSLHSIGQIFDIKSDFLGDYTPAKTGYRLDSISIIYSYIQNIPGLADTLVFQYYTSDSNNTNGIIKGQLPNGDKTAYIKANVNTSLGIGARKQYKYLINRRDTTTNFKVLTVPVPGGMDVPAGQISGFTITYKPGYSYSQGDTLDSRWDQPSPRKKINNFRVFIQNDQAKEQDNSYNHSLTLNRVVKYNINAGNWANMYIPGDAWNYHQHLYSAFQIAYCPTSNCTLPTPPSNDTIGGTPTFAAGIEANNQNGFMLSNIFPNPAQNSATLEFVLPATENVKVQIYNVVGQQIQTVASGNYASGKHTININTEGMKPGIYFYTFTAGNITQTKRFSIVK